MIWYALYLYVITQNVINPIITFCTDSDTKCNNTKCNNI